MSALFQSLTGLTFAHPWMLSLALLIPIGLLARRLQGRPRVRFAPSALIERRTLPITWRALLLPLPRLLQVAGLLLVVIALARPVLRQPLPLQSKGIDIFLCLDISSSMNADDMDRQRTRLEVARDSARKFIAARPNDRIGLIRFAGFPDLLCPLTLDHVALDSFLTALEMVEPDGPEDLTGIGTAVASAAQVLSGSEAKSKVVILFTDGEENVATDATPDEIGPLRAAQLCRRLGIRVYSIVAGIGRRTPKGEWIELDSRQVQRLAELTGGRFYRARDANAVAEVYDEINRLERVEFEDPRFKVMERFLPFLVGALGLILLSRLLQCTVLEVMP